MKRTIHYLSRTDHPDHGIAHFSISGICWDYWLTSLQLSDCEFMARRFSSPKALAYAKRHAIAFAKLGEPSPIAATFLRHRGAQASRQRKLKVTLPNV